MKITEMLRLSELRLSQRQVAGSAGCAKSTVGDVLKLCREKHVNYEQASQMADRELHDLLYPEAKVERKGSQEPDWKGYRRSWPNTRSSICSICGKNTARSTRMA